MSGISPLWSVASIALAACADMALPDSPLQPAGKRPYFLYALIFSAAGALLVAAAGRLNAAVRERAGHQAAWFTAVFLFLNMHNLATKKLALLPALFFPSPDRVIGALAADWRHLLVDCLGSSAKLLATGFFTGAAAGLATGVAVGFSARISYWVNPLIRLLGPIPPTAWIPVVLVAFPTTFLGGAFLIALSVWFPTTVMTASGIANVQNAYFEVASTLGASRRRQIFRVGIPAALPFIFIGVFTGACSSFITLMTAEMLGVKNGIGWYVNWQREMLSYANVYAGLIVIAAGFYLLITLLFKIRDYALVWQKGVIKW